MNPSRKKPVLCSLEAVVLSKKRKNLCTLVICNLNKKRRPRIPAAGALLLVRLAAHVSNG